MHEPAEPRRSWATVDCRTRCRPARPAPLPALDVLEGMSRAELFDVALDRGIRHRELIMLDRDAILALLVEDGSHGSRPRQPAGGDGAGSDPVDHPDIDLD